MSDNIKAAIKACSFVTVHDEQYRVTGHVLEQLAPGNEDACLYVYLDDEETGAEQSYTFDEVVELVNDNDIQFMKTVPIVL